MPRSTEPNLDLGSCSWVDILGQIFWSDCIDRRRHTMMPKVVCGTLGVLGSVACALPAAHAQAADSAVEFAFMPRTMTVTLLNEGGKYVVVDMRHIPQGGTCRMDKDAPIVRVGAGGSP